MVSRMSRSMVFRFRSALVVTSPATTTRSVVTRVSQATRLVGSALRQWSRTASLIWSATLSGWPSDTDSLVNSYRSVLTDNPLMVERRPALATGHTNRPIVDEAADFGNLTGWEGKTGWTGRGRQRAGWRRSRSRPVVSVAIVSVSTGTPA